MVCLYSKVLDFLFLTMFSNQLLLVRDCSLLTSSVPYKISNTLKIPQYCTALNSTGPLGTEKMERGFP